MVPELRRLRHEVVKFNANLGYVHDPISKKKKKKKKRHLNAKSTEQWFVSA